MHIRSPNNEGGEGYGKETWAVSTVVVGLLGGNRNQPGMVVVHAGIDGRVGNTLPRDAGTEMVEVYESCAPERSIPLPCTCRIEVRLEVPSLFLALGM